MDNNRGGRNGREVGRAGGWAVVGGKGKKLYLNNNKIKIKKFFFKEFDVSEYKVGVLCNKHLQFLQPMFLIMSRTTHCKNCMSQGRG